MTEMKNLRYAEAGLADYGLQTPPAVMRGQTFTRSVSEAYKGVKEFSREELIAKIEAEHGSFDESLSLDRLGFWRAVVSNSSLDTYFTRMSKSSLQNYATDASSPSVSFQNSHRHFELPVGRSVVGQLIESGNLPQGARAEDFYPGVVVDFYSHRDLQLGEVSVEQFLLGINSHVVKDVSIGFKEGEGFRETCSICGGKFWSYDCRHIAGVEYAVSDAAGEGAGDPASGDGQTKKLCFVWIENARLSEVSAVYDGATTNAMIIKAEREARAGRLDSDTERFLERRFHFRADKKAWTSGFDQNRKPDENKTEADKEKDRGEKPENLDKSEDKTVMTEQEIRAAATKEYADKARSFAKEIGIEVAEDVSPEVVFEQIRADYATQKANAARYIAARDAEIGLALDQKVRAEGVEALDEEKTKTVRSMLENCDIAVVQEFKAEWQTAGDKRFGKGRTSKDAGEGADDPAAAEDEKTRSTETLPSFLNQVDPSVFAGAV